MGTFFESGIRQRKERDELRLSSAVGENSYAKRNTYSSFSPGKYGCIVISIFLVSGGGLFLWGTTRGIGGGSDSHLCTIKGLLPGQAHNAATKLIWKYGFDSLLFFSSGLLTPIFKRSVASFSDAYYEVHCNIFDESSCWSSASSKITYCSRLHSYDATPSVFETKFCENLFELTNIVCCYETRNDYGLYRNSHDVI